MEADDEEAEFDQAWAEMQRVMSELSPEERMWLEMLAQHAVDGCHAEGISTATLETMKTTLLLGILDEGERPCRDNCSIEGRLRLQ